MKRETWRGCYDNGWQEGEITAESFSHPAKMAKGLVYKIVKTGLERGWWKKDDIIVDCFGGIGSTGLACSSFGMASIAVELERKFCYYSMQNYKLNARNYCVCKENNDNDSYMRWLQTAISSLSDSIEAKEGEPVSEDVLQQGMFFSDETGGHDGNLRVLQEPISDVSISEIPLEISGREEGFLQSGVQAQRVFGREQSSLQGREGLDFERLSLLQDTGMADGTSRTSSSVREDTGSPSRKGRTSASRKRRQAGQPAREPEVGRDWHAQALAQLRFESAKATLPKMCPHCGKPNAPLPITLQGDSRQLASIVRASGCVTSPPYAETQLENRGNPNRLKNIEKAIADGKPIGRESRRVLDKGFNPNTQVDSQDSYGSTPGQIGAMKEGSFGVVTSPPYGELDPSATHAQGSSRKNPKSKNYRPFAERTWETSETPRDYGTTPGQIGNLGAITSPPFSTPETRDRAPVQDGSVSDAMNRAYTQDRQAQDPANIASLPIGAITSPPYAQALHPESVDPEKRKARELRYQANHPDIKRPPFRDYGATEGQLGAMPEGAPRIAAVTSPPYEGLTADIKGHGIKGAGVTNDKHYGEAEYGATEGNVGNERGETYWTAVEQVYRQVYELFGRNSHMAVVIKAFVRKKQIVPLPEMTLALLEKIGFEPVLWVNASLVGEKQPSMMDEVPDYMWEKKSFFRRLHEKKHPETKINEEVVLVVRKP